MLTDKQILLIITGGIAAYKVLDLIRRLRERGVGVTCVMTKAAKEFVTPLSVQALSENPVYDDLFNLTQEDEIGHIRLSRGADLVVVAPASADFLAKMAHGLAGDLAGAVLLASDKPVLVAPAMNPFMWEHPATRRNCDQLRRDGIHFIGPEAGEMAERHEAGVGRMSEPLEIVQAIEDILTQKTRLCGCHVLITAGPTHEPIDPVRYIANRSSGKQGYAIAEMAARAGARVTLISGPTGLDCPPCVERISVETALEMKAAVEAALPADIAIMAAAVADWRVGGTSEEKIKKEVDGEVPSLSFVENPDILNWLGHAERRPKIVVGFAAETERVIEHATAKLERKGADFIVANDVSPEEGVMGGDENTIHILRKISDEVRVDSLQKMSKQEVARVLIDHIAALFQEKS